MSKERDIIAEANKKLVLATLTSVATIVAITAIVLGFTPLGENVRVGISELENKIANSEQSTTTTTKSNSSAESTILEKRITELLSALTESGSLKRAGMGIRYITINEETAAAYDLPVKNGAFIPTEDSIMDGMPAEKAGLRAGDIITRIDDIAIDAENPLNYLVARHAIGDTISVTYLRDGQARVVTVKLAKLSTK